MRELESPSARRRRRSTRLAVVLLIAAAGWGGWLAARVGFDVGAYYTDGERAFVTQPAVRSAVWRDPEPLRFEAVTEGGELAGAARRPTISPDGRLLVFAAGARGANAELFISERREAGWSVPQPLVELNSSADDMAPSFGPDALYFASDRGPFERGLDLWRASWDQLGFGAPKRLEPWVQSDADDTDPVLLDNGALLFASKRDGDDFDLFEGTLDGVRPLDALNSSADERDPTGSAGGAVLWFASDRAGGAGQFDPYQSFVGRDGWMAPRHVTELATGADERGLWVDADGFTLVFERGTAIDNTLLTAHSREIYEMPAPAVGWRELALLGALLLLALGAWLSRRYTGLEFLTRCMLASLLLHIGLLWWLRDVHPDAPNMVGVGEEMRYAVTLIADNGGDEHEGRSTSAQANGPKRHALEQGQPTIAARSVRARSVDRSSDTAQRAVEQPQASREPARARIALPTVAAREFEEPAQAHADPRVTGAARSKQQDSSPMPRHKRGSDAKRQRRVAAADAPAPEARAVRPPVAARGRTGATQQATRSGLTSRPLALGQHVDLPKIAVTAGSAQTSQAPARLAPVTFGAQPSRVVRGPARSQRSKPRRLSAQANDAGLDRRSSARTGAVYQPNRPSSSTTIAATPARLMPLVEQAAAEPLASHASTTNRSTRRSVSFERTRRTAEAGPRRRIAARAPLVAEAGHARLERRTPIFTADRAQRPVAPVYQNRFGAERDLAVTRYGGDEQTERSVRLGLEYLATIQRDSGGWGRRHRDSKYGDVRIGKSGLALLAYLGAGHVPGAVVVGTGTEPGQYARTVQRAVDFLLERQQAGGHFGESNAYGHGIATYALCEAFALTRLESLRQPIERALAHMLAFQVSSSQPKLNGGWGYFTQDHYGDGDDRWPRVSVTAWQVMALVSARTSGFDVPVQALSDAKSFLLASWDTDLGAYRYTHDPDRLNSNYPTLPASTPAALFALSLLGEDVSGSRFEEPRRFVLERSPRSFRMRSNALFVERADGNLYCWAYATLALFRVGGTPWRRWNAALKEVLLPAQRDNGSWPSVSAYGQYADDTDDAYSTALGVMMMEVYYRYVTPTVNPSPLR